jgi:hypothetical protein
MRLIDGIKLVGKPATIPDCSRDDLPNFFREMGFKVGAEIGVLRGQFTEKLCQSGSQIFAIDPWLAYTGSGRTQTDQRVHDAIYEETKTRLSAYPNCTVVRKTSMEAVKDFLDGGLDFVYIDGDHSFTYIAGDIAEWSKKVRKGGVIAGHDYFNTIPQARNIVVHVKAVVDAYTKLFGINNWWIFGKVGHGDDKFYSWMWIKP